MAEPVNLKALGPDSGEDLRGMTREQLSQLMNRPQSPVIKGSGVSRVSPRECDLMEPGGLFQQYDR
jgi:hypothetical protein